MKSETKPKIWLSSPHMGGNEINYVNEAFETNWVAPIGPHISAFEQQITDYLGIKGAAALSSGTAAIHLGLILLGVKAGDEVICQSFTFSASANPILYLGAIPIFIDSERLTGNMDPELLEEAIKDRMAKGKKPKVIIPVHLYGMPANMQDIMNIANRYEIPILEDAAESLGSSYLGNRTGTFGSIGALSFNGNKIITTSGGGALVSNNQDYINQAKFLSTQARDEAPHYQHSQIGYNYRISNISAGIGRGQMEVLKDRIRLRRRNFEYYREKLINLESIEFLMEPKGYFSNRWLTTIIVKPYYSVDREKIREALLEENIESRPLWKPMHMQPLFESYLFYGNGVSEKMFMDGLCLPSGSNLGLEDLNRVVNIIKLLYS